MSVRLFPRSRSGATLIEAVLSIAALGIISIGILGGLLVGLQTAHKARNLAVMAQVRDYLYSQVEGGTNSVANLSSNVYYFDNEGLTLSSGSNTWAYEAQMSLALNGSSVAIPSGSVNTNLLSIAIIVTARSGYSKTNYLYFAHP